MIGDFHLADLRQLTHDQLDPSAVAALSDFIDGHAGEPSVLDRADFYGVHLELVATGRKA